MKKLLINRERKITNMVKYIFTFILRGHIHFRDILYFALEHDAFSLKRCQGKRLWFLNMNGFRELKFSHTKMGRNEKKKRSPPVGQHSYITHFKIKSETEFWQACYFLQCQEAHNRPFFFWTKLLKCLEIQMYWVTELYKYCTPIPAGAPARSFGNNTIFSLCLAEGKKYFN